MWLAISSPPIGGTTGFASSQKQGTGLDVIEEPTKIELSLLDREIRCKLE